MSSHLLAEVEHLADDVIVINEGRLIAQGSLADLQRTAAFVRTPQPAQLAELVARSGATSEPHGPDGLLVRGAALSDIGDLALTAGVAIHELSQRAGSLEELFLAWTTGPTDPEVDQS